VEPLEKQESVAIIIVNWNQKNTLAACLSSLKNKTEYSNYNVVVVDNGSSDGSVELLKQNFPWADVIGLDKNYGFSIGNNKGIAHAFEKYKPQYFLLLNDDTQIIQSDWLTKIVAAAESEDDVGIIGCKLVYPNGKTQYIGTKITVQKLMWLNPNSESRLPEVFDVDAVLGACFLVKRAVFDKIGFLDAGFSPFLHEESDFCMRAKKAGYRTRMVRSVSVVHFLNKSLGKVDSPYFELITRKNAIRFMLLNFPTSWLLKRVPVEVKILVACFIARNKNKKGKLPIKLRTGRELLIRLRANFYGWLYNLRSLCEILTKRRDRAAKLLSIE
jgi:GT2 family glycosyltransferase